jgi:hypothetical protein
MYSTLGRLAFYRPRRVAASVNGSGAIVGVMGLVSRRIVI